MVWPCFKVFWSSKDNPTGYSERKNKKRQTEEEMGRQYSKSGQEWTSPVQLGQLKTGQNGKGFLRIHLWWPDDLLRLWDRIEKNRIIRCFIKSDRAGLFIEHSINFRLNGEH